MPLSDNKGIWLFFNKKGSLISKIPNGQVVRQSGSFTLIFAFEDEKYMNGKSLSIGFQKPGEKGPSVFLPMGSPQEIMFKKYKANEITYGLVDGKIYRAYKLDILSDWGYTEKYGILNVISKITKVVGNLDKVDSDFNGIPDNSENDDIVYFQGSVQLYVEPTYGKKQDSSTISYSDAEKLTERINDIANDKLDKDGGIATNLTFESGTITTNVIVGSNLENSVIGKSDVELKIDETVNNIKKSIGIKENFNEIVLHEEFDQSIENIKNEAQIESFSDIVNQKEFDDTISNIKKESGIENFNELVNENELAEKTAKFVYTETMNIEEDEVPVVLLADKATNDSLGRNIVDTYITKDEAKEYENTIDSIELNGQKIEPNEEKVVSINVDVPDISNLGRSISATLDANYNLTIYLYNEKQEVVSQTETFDLPLESAVVGGSYDDTTKKIILTLQNGNTINIPVADLVKGLVSESREINGKSLIKDITLGASDVGAYTTAETDAKLTSIRNDLTSNVQTINNKFNDYVTLTKLESDLQGYITSIVRNPSADTEQSADGTVPGTFAYIVNFKNGESVSLVIPKPVIVTAEDGVITIEV